MGTTLTIGFAVAGALFLFGVGSLAAWRMIPRREPPPDVQMVWAECKALRTAYLDLDERVTTWMQREKGRRRHINDKAPEPVPETKDQLRARVLGNGVTNRA